MIDETDLKDHSFNVTDNLSTAVDRKGHQKTWVPTKSIDFEAGVNRDVNPKYIPVESPKPFFNYSDLKTDESLLGKKEPLESFDVGIFSYRNGFINKKPEDLIDFSSLSRSSSILSTPPWVDSSSIAFETDFDGPLKCDRMKPDNTGESNSQVEKCVDPLDCVQYTKEKDHQLPPKGFSRQNSFASNQSVRKSQHNNLSGILLNQIAESHSLLAMPVITSPQMAEVEEEVKNNERRQIPNGTKTCFSMKLKKDNVLELASVKGKEKAFNQWNELRDVKKVEVSVEHLRLADDEILKNLCMILGQIDKVENISLDFEKTRYEASVQRQFEERLEKLFQICFEGQKFLANIHLVWDRSHGANIVCQRISQQLQNSASTLKHLDLDFKNTKLDYDDFQALIERVRTMQVTTSKVKTFKFASELISVREEKVQFNALSMPDAEEFSLDLTCSGPFGGELMEFIIKSLSSMKKIKTLCLKLSIGDFRDNNSSEKWIKDLFDCIQSINENLLILKVIISLNNKDERQDEGASYESLVRIAAQSLKVHRIRNLVIGPNILKVQELSGMGKVSKFLKDITL